MYLPFLLPRSRAGADDDIERLKRSLFGTRGGADAPLNVQVCKGVCPGLSQAHGSAHR